MRKIVPLINMESVKEYKVSQVSCVLMGTAFSATRQLKNYTISEIAEVNKEIPVIAVFNRFFYEPEMQEVYETMKAMREAGIAKLICTDLGVVQINKKYQLGFEVILDTDTTMTNALDIGVIQEHGVDEVVVGRELTLEEQLNLGRACQHLGTHFFGYQLMSFSRRHHLSNYKDFRNLDFDINQSFWIRESKRDEDYLTFEDQYGTHIYAPKILSAIHTYGDIKETGAYDSLYFEIRELDYKMVLDICRNIDAMTDFKDYEKQIEKKYGVSFTHGLLYTKTNQGGNKHA